MIQLLLNFSNDYLIEFMGAVLGLCLVVRWFAFMSSKKNDTYFSTLTREINNSIERDKEERIEVKDIDTYLGSFFSRITDKLPNRSFRFKEEKLPMPGQKNVVPISGYLTGRENFVNILKGEVGIFHCQTPPNFGEITHRILSQDSHWTTMLKKLPIDGVSRLIDIMPGLFVVFGVFGTFVGISLALPEIANIDFNNLDGSGDTLTRFVTKTAYAMETSLAGIFFSVIMTVMNALFPIRDMRNSIHKKIETSLQALWYHVHYASKAENEIHAVLKELNETLKGLKEKPSDLKKVS